MEEDQRRKYEEYIKGASPMAAVIGRRIPYHLEYIRKYGNITPVPKGKEKKTV